jgi:hypothetical protein
MSAKRESEFEAASETSVFVAFAGEMPAVSANHLTGHSKHVFSFLPGVI